MILRVAYTITYHRLTIRLGLLAREVHETRLDRVQNVKTSQSLIERMLGIGTVDFDTAGGAGFDFDFRGISSPDDIVQTVSQALQTQGLEPSSGAGCGAAGLGRRAAAELDGGPERRPGGRAAAGFGRGERGSSGGPQRGSSVARGSVADALLGAPPRRPCRKRARPIISRESMHVRPPWAVQRAPCL